MGWFGALLAPVTVSGASTTLSVCRCPLLLLTFVGYGLRHYTAQHCLLYSEGAIGVWLLQADQPRDGLRIDHSLNLEGELLISSSTPALDIRIDLAVSQQGWFCAYASWRGKMPISDCE